LVPNVLIQLRLTPDQLARVDAWRDLLHEQARVPVSRAAALRNLIETHPSLRGVEQLNSKDSTPC
jgi:hypothetical protein